MLNVQTIDDVAVVSGYDDGTEWFFEGAPCQGVFGPGGARLWQFRGSEVRIVDLVRRAVVGVIPLDVGPGVRVRAIAADGGARLWVVGQRPAPEGGAPGAPKPIAALDLIAVDLDRGAVVGRLRDQPLGAERDAVVMADGSLLLATVGRRDGEMLDVMTRVGWGDLEITQSVVPARRAPDTSRAIHWRYRSPDGRWWLRFDHTCFPMVERSDGPGTAPRAYYGVTLQLWSAFPLRFERRIVVHWLKAEDLPDESGLFRPWDIPRTAFEPAPAPAPAADAADSLLRRVFGRRAAPPPAAAPAAAAAPVSLSPQEAAMLASAPARDRIYRAISRALHWPGAAPDAPFPERADFGEEAVADDALWAAITANLGTLVGRTRAAVAWDADGEAVWLDRAGFLTRVQMDGAVSPPLWCERFGLKRGMMIPYAEAAELHLPMPGGRLLAMMPPRDAIGTVSAAREGGALVIDGSPAEPRHAPVMIPAADDGWIPGGEAIPPHIRDRARYQAAIAARKAQSSVVRIPVGGADAASRAGAVDALASLIGPEFFARARDHEIDIVFVVGAKAVREAAFFSAIGPDDRAWATPALRRLVGRYVEANGDRPETFYQPDGEGDSILAHAVLRLAQIDPGSLPLVRAFGQTIDGGHEYFFAGTIVPAVIEAHGWTRDVVAFVFWVLLYNFYNSFDRVSTVWRDLGLYRAVSVSRPEDVAAFVAATFAPAVADGGLTWDAMATLKRELGSAAEGWEVQFFEALERAAPGSVMQAG